MVALFCVMTIGVFDSGYGGLTILDSMRCELPEYDYLYLGDNARAPYGTRSFDVIYEYTLEAVRWLLGQGCALVVLACNTASAKALRTIQQKDLPVINAERLAVGGERVNVLGVIRPTVEAVPSLTKNGHIGILATPATVSSESYVLELEKIGEQRIQNTDRYADRIQKTDFVITQQACPMWVPLIEAGEHLSSGADFFVAEYLDSLYAQDPEIDTLVLGCTHYPLLMDKIRAHLNSKNLHPAIIAQGDIVARSLHDYLHRHSEYDRLLTRNGRCQFATTESLNKFESNATIFLQTPILANHVTF